MKEQTKITVSEVARMMVILAWLGSFLHFLAIWWYNIHAAIYSGAIFTITSLIISRNKDSFRLIDDKDYFSDIFRKKGGDQWQEG